MTPTRTAGQEITTLLRSRAVALVENLKEPPIVDISGEGVLRATLSLAKYLTAAE